jgi:hypothetical protein
MVREIEKKNHGGKRPNAGRPLVGVEKVTSTLKLLPETSEAINVLAKDPKSYGAVVDKAVKYLLENTK